MKAFSSRKGTPLYYLKNKTGDIEIVLWFLAEGVDISVMVRYTGKADATIARWLDRMGEHDTSLHDVFFKGLTLALIQRAHKSLQVPVPGLKRRYRSRSPAVALGLTDHLWSVADLLTYPLVPSESAA